MQELIRQVQEACAKVVISNHDLSNQHRQRSRYRFHLAEAIRALDLSHLSAKTPKYEEIGRSTGNFHFSASGKAIFEAKAFDSLPAPGSKLYIQSKPSE